LALDVADTSADVIQEVFITERTPDALDATSARVRLFEGIAGATPAALVETTAGPDAVTVLRDITGDGVPDATILWRATDGALMASQAAGALSFTPTTSMDPGCVERTGRTALANCQRLERDRRRCPR